MVESFLPAHSILLFDSETLSDEVFAFLGHNGVESDIFGHDVVDKLELIFCRPWGHSMNQLIVDKANRPQIRFVGVLLVIEYLRGHVKWSTDNGFEDSALSIL